MNEDNELLRRYVDEKSQEAFAELVRLRIGLVYGVALRHTRDSHRAEDVTQAVFTALARKADRLLDRAVLVGWLFRTTQYAAADAVRAESRRQIREQASMTMEHMERESPEPDWTKLRPVIDEILNEMDERDRDAVLLRYFDGQSFGEVGTKLRLSENAARMRVERALDKLRTKLARRGVTSTSAALALALASQPAVAVPTGLAAAVTGAALAGGVTALTATGAAAGGTAAAGAWATFMSMTKLQLGIASVLAAATGTGLILQARENTRLQSEVMAVQQQNQPIADLRTQNARLAKTATEVADYKSDDADLAQLRDQSASLQTRMQRVAQAEQAQASNVYELKNLDHVPRVTGQFPPKYPFELRRLGVSGKVVVDFIVDRDGNVQNPLAVNSALLGEASETTPNVVKMARVNVAGESVSANQPAPQISAEEARKQFESAAIEAVKQWKFDAGLKSGRPVNTHMQVPIIFQLDHGLAK